MADPCAIRIAYRSVAIDFADATTSVRGARSHSVVPDIITTVQIGRTDIGACDTAIGACDCRVAGNAIVRNSGAVSIGDRPIGIDPTWTTSRIERAHACAVAVNDIIANPPWYVSRRHRHVRFAACGTAPPARYWNKAFAAG